MADEGTGREPAERYGSQARTEPRLRLTCMVRKGQVSDLL